MSLEPFKIEPARDLGLSHRQRTLSLHRESGLIETCTHSLWWAGMRGYLKTYHRLQVIGRSHLPPKPPYVLIADHTSHLDAMVLASQLPYRHRDRIFPIAAGDTFFQTPVLATFAMACLNALPMWRHNCGRHALNDLRQRLVEDRCIYIIFPEGTRSRSGQQADYRAGLGMLVAESDVPVVPCLIEGAYRALPADKRLPRPGKLRLHIGPAMTFAEQPNRKAGWQYIAEACQTAVQRLA